MSNVFDRSLGVLRIENQSTTEIAWFLRRTCLKAFGQRIPVIIEVGEIESRYFAVSTQDEPLRLLIDRLRAQDAHYDWEEADGILIILPKLGSILQHRIPSLVIRDEYLVPALSKVWSAQEEAEVMGELMIGVFEPVNHTANVLEFTEQRFSLTIEDMRLKEIVLQMVRQSKIPFDFTLTRAPREERRFSYFLDLRV